MISFWPSIYFQIFYLMYNLLTNTHSAPRCTFVSDFDFFFGTNKTKQRENPQIWIFLICNERAACSLFHFWLHFVLFLSENRVTNQLIPSGSGNIFVEKIKTNPSVQLFLDGCLHRSPCSVPRIFFYSIIYLLIYLNHFSFVFVYHTKLPSLARR